MMSGRPRRRLNRPVSVQWRSSSLPSALFIVVCRSWCSHRHDWFLCSNRSHHHRRRIRVPPCASVKLAANAPKFSQIVGYIFLLLLLFLVGSRPQLRIAYYIKEEQNRFSKRDCTGTAHSRMQSVKCETNIKCRMWRLFHCHTDTVIANPSESECLQPQGEREAIGQNPSIFTSRHNEYSCTVAHSVPLKK